MLIIVGRAGRIYLYGLHEQFGWDNPEAQFKKPLIDEKYAKSPMAQIYKEFNPTRGIRGCGEAQTESCTTAYFTIENAIMITIGKAILTVKIHGIILNSLGEMWMKYETLIENFSKFGLLFI
ncbi:hypothetical protein NSS79_03735 [Paenibacillus sp. FSL L8-0436]|uniref:hypothetical protein n=1 Tax=Paenibacillus sp. FSL L8-0436 TaxID=2954686 RepID=UPI0031590937